MRAGIGGEIRGGGGGAKAYEANTRAVELSNLVRRDLIEFDGFATDHCTRDRDPTGPRQPGSMDHEMI